MKTRQGFVSNSSSSSYIVLIPSQAEVKLYGGEYADLLNQLMNDGELWQEEVKDYDKYDGLVEALKPYTIAQMQTSSEAGQIVLADKEKARKIINEG